METLQFILINIVLPLTVGILGSFAYPRIESYFKNRSLSFRERRIKALLGDYRTVKVINENIQGLQIIVLREIASGLFQLTILILVIGTIILANLTESFWRMMIIIIIISFLGTNTYQTFRKIRDIMNKAILFDKYKEKTIAKLKKLSGNPEDLDKEETEA